MLVWYLVADCRVFCFEFDLCFELLVVPGYFIVEAYLLFAGVYLFDSVCFCFVLGTYCCGLALSILCRGGLVGRFGLLAWVVGCVFPEFGF